MVQELLTYHDGSDKFGALVAEGFTNYATVMTALGYQAVRNTTLQGSAVSYREVLWEAQSGS